ncbi:MAG: hypothetical protein JXE07_02225, partial [Candidatus Aminicenantes bacterium]|nr:hypothetical protein [Candidatus Aminicenantes bacterium]
MLDDLKENAESYDKIREIALDNSVPPAFRFDPVIPGMSVEKTGTVRFVSAAGEKAAGKVWDGPGNDDRSDPRNLFSLEERESRERVKEGGPSPRSEENAAAERPADIEELAFAPVTRLAELIRARKITSTELTRMYLARLKRYGPRLECIVTLTEDLAIAQAARADGEIAAGRYRGPLHGIPYGAKDLLAVKGTKTTWGAKAYEDQMIDDNA